MKKIFALFSAAVCILLLSACARDLIPEEVLQLPKAAKLYTSYNLWYEDPEELGAANVLRGKILPFGSEVHIVSMTTKEVVFLSGSTRFRIRLRTDQGEFMEAFARELFKTFQADELLTGVSSVNYERIKRGVVVKGMNRADVKTAYGPPAKDRTPVMENDTWIYQVDSVKGRRVVFRNGYVLEVLELD